MKWEELEEVLLDVEVTLNNRPLTYVEDDVELPVITPNTLIHGFPVIHVPEDNPDITDEKDLRKRVRYIKKCKDDFWKRWRDEYLRGLREKHNLTHHNKESTIAVGDVVIIKDEEKNRGKWKIGIVDKIHPSRDGVTRAVRLKTENSYLDRAMQQLYPLELQCYKEKVENCEKSKTFKKSIGETFELKPSRRSQRMAAADARMKINIETQDELDDNVLDW